MALGGVALRLGGTFLRFIQFAAAIVILGIFSYFLAIQTRQNIIVPTWVRAVEGLTGATALYTLFGVILTCFLGGNSFFGGLAMFLDVLFIGANVAIAIETRGGDQNCNNVPDDSALYTLRLGPEGLGNFRQHDYVPRPYHACTLLKAAFALSIINALLFLISVFYQMAIVRHHRYEKTHATGPNTPVLAGQKRGFWRRRRGARADVEKNNGYANGNGYNNNAVNY